MRLPGSHLGRRGEIGASAAEYALLVALVALIILGAVSAFGTEVQSLFQDSCDGVANAGGNASC